MIRDGIKVLAKFAARWVQKQAGLMIYPNLPVSQPRFVTRRVLNAGSRAIIVSQTLGEMQL